MTKSHTVNLGETKRIQTNLLEQNCYVRDFVSPFDEKNDYQNKTFVSLDEKIVDDGVKEVYTQNDYPITPESVNSYSDSVDYKVDPLAAVNLPAAGKNIGDVSMYQKILEMNPIERRAFLDSLNAAIPKTEEVKNEVVKKDE